MNSIRNWISEVRFETLVVLGWVITAIPNLDGILYDESPAFNLLRWLAAWYVLISGITIFINTFRELPKFLVVLSWMCFGVGLLSWGFVAAVGFWMFLATAIGSFFLAHKEWRDV